MTMATRSEGAGPPGVRQLVARARVLSLSDRDNLLYELVMKFRAGNRSVWAPLILDMLATSLKIRVSRYCPTGATMTIGDIYQEFVCALLEDALSIPLDGPAHLERRLLLRSADRVSRSLQREARYQQDFESLEAWADTHDDQDADKEDQR